MACEHHYQTKDGNADDPLSYIFSLKGIMDASQLQMFSLSPYDRVRTACHGSADGDIYEPMAIICCKSGGAHLQCMITNQKKKKVLFPCQTERVFLIT